MHMNAYGLFIVIVIIIIISRANERIIPHRVNEGTNEWNDRNFKGFLVKQRAFIDFAKRNMREDP